MAARRKTFGLSVLLLAACAGVFAAAVPLAMADTASLRPTTVKATASDTWVSLARTYLGDPDAAGELAQFNRSTLATSLKNGQKIMIPGEHRDRAAHAVKNAKQALIEALTAGVQQDALDQISQKSKLAEQELGLARYSTTEEIARAATAYAHDEILRAQAAKGTRVAVVVDAGSGTANDGSSFTVEGGRLQVTAGGVTTNAGAGEAVKVTAKGLPTKVIAPPAPNPINPVHGSVLRQQGVVLNWAAVPTATRYNVQVARDPLFHEGIIVQSVQTPELALPSTLENGTFWWKVTAVNGGGIPGLASAPQRFILTVDHSMPTVEVGRPIWD